MCTTTCAPSDAKPRANSATWTFWPPASTPPSTASGLACSDTMLILTRSPLESRSWARCPNRLTRQRVDCVCQRGCGCRRKARLTRDRTRACATAGTLDRLVTDEHVRNSPRMPPRRRHDRSEHRRHGSADCGGEMRGTRVPADDRFGAGEHAREVAQRSRHTEGVSGKVGVRSDARRE